jgi:hypothetical protein
MRGDDLVGGAAGDFGHAVERNSTINSPISASGIMARTQSQPGQPSRVSKPRIWPRRADRMALILAVASVGQTISTT